MVGHALLKDCCVIDSLKIPLQLIWPLYLGDYVCFLELCRPSEMPQSMASCWTLHCFMHVWWIYISLDGNFFWIGTGQSFNTEAFDM